MTAKPLTLEAPQAALVRSLWLGNLLILALLGGGAFVVAPWRAAVSVLVGGVIALVNFRVLEKSIYRALLPRGPKSGGSVMGRALVKYYLRFALTALVIFILVRQGWVEPLGLLVGLSVVVLSIFAWGALQARKLFKEAV